MVPVLIPLITSMNPNRRACICHWFYKTQSHQFPFQRSGLRTIVPIICPERWIIAGPHINFPPKPGTHPGAGRLNPISAAAWHLYNCPKRAQTWRRAGYWILLDSVLVIKCVAQFSCIFLQTVTVVQHTKAPNFSGSFTVHISHLHAFACTRCIFLQQSISNRKEVNLNDYLQFVSKGLEIY